MVMPWALKAPSTSDGSRGRARVQGSGRRAAEEQALTGGQQVQPKTVKPPGLHPSLKQAGAQLQGNQVWRERLEQLLQVPATLEACIEELHCG